MYVPAVDGAVPVTLICVVLTGAAFTHDKEAETDSPVSIGTDPEIDPVTSCENDPDVSTDIVPMLDPVASL